MQALVFQNWEPEGPGIFADVLNNRGWAQDVVHLYRGEAIPSDWQNYDLLVVMGGPMNVYEEDTYPFLAQETVAIQKALEKDEYVGSIISLPVIMAEGNRAPLAFLLSWEGLLQRMDQPKYNNITRAFVTQDRVSGYFFIRMKESLRNISRLEVINRIKELVTNYGFVPEMMGGIYLLQGELSRLVASSLIFGLGRLILLFVLIALVVSGSIAASLSMVLSLCVVPVCIIGAAGHLQIPLDIISAPAANVAIGMGIDSMIHLAVFARRQIKSGATKKEAWALAQFRLWQPIAGATLIICTGFAIFGLSSFPPTQRFGLAIVFGTILASVSALFVLPFLATLKFKKK